VYEGIVGQVRDASSSYKYGHVLTMHRMCYRTQALASLRSPDASLEAIATQILLVSAALSRNTSASGATNGVRDKLVR
jgi:hypothetical protein